MKNLDAFLSAMDEASDAEVASIAATAFAIMAERGSDAWAAFGRAFRSQMDEGERTEAKAQFEDVTA